MKLPWQEKSPIENLMDAYKIGDMPLALVVFGASCLVGGVAEDWINKVGAPFLMIAGAVVIVAGAAAWTFGAYFKSSISTGRLVALLQCLFPGCLSCKRWCQFPGSAA
jgi:hypothetical protein